MPKRIPTDLVILYRDGKQIVPEVGKEFDFTTDELTSIAKSNPKVLAKVGDQSEVIAAPIDESPYKAKAK